MDRLTPMRKLLSEAGKRCRPPLPRNTGMSVCTVRSRDFPELSLANMVKQRPDKIDDLKECIRLNLLFYAAHSRIIVTEGAEDIRDRKRLDEIGERLAETQRTDTCAHNVVKMWRFIRNMKGIEKLDSFFG